MFRRRGRGGQDPVDAPVEADTELDETGAEDEPGAATSGPWDVTEAPQDEVARLDLGALQVPTLPEVEVRVEADPNGEISAVLLVHHESGLQLGAFAAPRTEGIWTEVRTEIGDGIIAEGGKITEQAGDFGAELVARVPTPDGEQPVRFVGVDGPRWFLRAVFTGAAALDREADDVLAESLRQVVVVRGNEPMPVRDPLPLRLPREIVEQQAGEEQEQAPKGIQPPRRGPEITEVR